MVEELSSQFEVTPQTIRKDLNELCDKRLLTRIMAAPSCRLASKTSATTRGA